MLEQFPLESRVHIFLNPNPVVGGEVRKKLEIVCGHLVLGPKVLKRRAVTMTVLPGVLAIGTERAVSRFVLAPVLDALLSEV